MTRTHETWACPRCDGKGNLAWAKRVHNGICYACKGTGQGLEADWSAPTLRRTEYEPDLNGDPSGPEWGWFAADGDLIAHIAVGYPRDMLLGGAKRILCGVMKTEDARYRRERVLSFAAVCWATKEDEVIARGRAAVARDLPEALIATYDNAINVMNETLNR